MSTPPEAETIRSLTNIAKILALIYGILLIIYGIITIIAFVGIVYIVFGIVDILIYRNCDEILELLDKREYRKAKEKTFTWMIIGLILGGIIVGILLLVAYIKYDEVIREAEKMAKEEAPPPPPPPV